MPASATKLYSLPLCAALALGLFAAAPAQAERCATSRRGELPVIPHRPIPYLSMSRAVVPLPTEGAHVHTTTHFRVLWGDAYDHNDPEWADPDGDGIPLWVQTITDTLEKAYAIQVNLGFSTPYGVEQYYIDAYVANTGVKVEGVNITLSNDFYAYTDIDAEYQTAYFIFNDDFSPHTTSELNALRATVVHELFHAVQRVDYPWDDEIAVPDLRWNEEKWWFEATATWMEELCEPESNEYIPYIQRFLAAPARSLMAADGEREYGAALFASYLWLRYGGAGLWQAISLDGYQSGVEAALRGQLAARGHDLDQTIAAFWALAAHPEDAWPEGAAYYPEDRSRMYRVLGALPTSTQVASSEAPARFGASLFRLPAGSAIVEAIFTPANGGADCLLSASSLQRNTALANPIQAGTPLSIKANAALGTTLALVSRGPAPAPPYRLAIIDRSPLLKGDVDGNNLITTADLILVLQIISAYPNTHAPRPGTTLNSNGITGQAEAVFILQSLSGLRNTGTSVP